MADFNFEELKVYQFALDVVDKVYDTTNSYPESEKFGWTSQFRRAAVSIPLNIVEGSGSTNKNFIRFLEIAQGSVRECVVCCSISKRRKYISDELENELRDELQVIAKMISNLKKYLNKD